MLLVLPPDRRRATFGLLEAEPWRAPPPPLGEVARQQVQLVAQREAEVGRVAAPARSVDQMHPGSPLPPAPIPAGARAPRPLQWRPTLPPSVASLVPSNFVAVEALAELVLHALPNATLVFLLRCAVAKVDVPRARLQGRVVAAEVLRRVQVACRQHQHTAPQTSVSVLVRASASERAAAPDVAPADRTSATVAQASNRLFDQAQRAAFSAVYALGDAAAARAKAAGLARAALQQLQHADGGPPADVVALLGAVRALSYLEAPHDDALGPAAVAALQLLVRAPTLAPFALWPDDIAAIEAQLQLLGLEGALVGGAPPALAALAHLSEQAGPYLQVWLRHGGPAAWSMLALARADGAAVGALARLGSPEKVCIALQEWLMAAYEALRAAQAAGAVGDGVREHIAQLERACREANLGAAASRVQAEVHRLLALSLTQGT